MKKIILSCVALVAAFVCASTISAQGVKVHPKGMGWVKNYNKSELSYIETYDAAESQAPSIEGTWKIKKLVTTADYMSEANWGMVAFGDAFPAFNAEDEITFENGKLTPNFRSNLKNFFKGDATYSVLDEFDFHFTSTMQMTTVQMLKVKGVNRNFDAATTSEDDEAYIGIRMVEDEDADEPGVYFMEVYLLDYQATSFAPEFVDYFFYRDEKPVAANSGMAIMFTMEKK